MHAMFSYTDVVWYTERIITVSRQTFLSKQGLWKIAHSYLHWSVVVQSN